MPLKFPPFKRQASKLTGSGQNEVGEYSITGTINGEHVEFVQEYHGKHSLTYAGKLSKTGKLEGVYTQPAKLGGGQGAFELQVGRGLESSPASSPDKTSCSSANAKLHTPALLSEPAPEPEPADPYEWMHTYLARLLPESIKTNEKVWNGTISALKAADVRSKEQLDAMSSDDLKMVNVPLTARTLLVKDRRRADGPEDSPPGHSPQSGLSGLSTPPFILQEGFWAKEGGRNCAPLLNRNGGLLSGDTSENEAVLKQTRLWPALCGADAIVNLPPVRPVAGAGTSESILWRDAERSFKTGDNACACSDENVGLCTLAWLTTSCSLFEH